MPRWALERRSLERKLGKVRARLVRAREQLRVLDEQLVAYDDEAEETRVRALVSESPEAVHDHVDSRRHLEAAQRSRQELVRMIGELEQEQDDLLDRLVSTSR